MAVSMKSLGIDKLSREERWKLADEIRESIEAEDENPGPSMLTDAQKQELERRIAEDDADPDGGIPWEVVKREALERLTAQ